MTNPKNANTETTTQKQGQQLLQPFQDTLKQNLKILPTYAHYRSQVMQSFVSLKHGTMPTTIFFSY
jgi:hypothetical protein